MKIRQSFCIPIIKPADMPLETLLRAAADIGYVGTEIWGRDDGFTALVALAGKCRLKVVSMVGHGGGLNDRGQHQKIAGELKASIDVAAGAGVGNLICFSGNRMPNIDDLAAIDAIADGLRLVAPHAEAKGVTLNLELLNSKIDHAGYQCDRTWFAAAVCEKVASPRVKMLYDIYHAQIMEGDIIRTIRQNVQFIGHFHTAGNPGRQDMDDTQEMNYAGICRAIAETGYDGYVGHEFKPKADAIKALTAAFKLCDQG